MVPVLPEIIALMVPVLLKMVLIILLSYKKLFTKGSGLHCKFFYLIMDRLAKLTGSTSYPGHVNNK